MKHLEVDLMLRGRYIHTMRIPILVADSIDSDGTPIFSESRLREYIVAQLPSLKEQPFVIRF